VETRQLIFVTAILSLVWVLRHAVSQTSERILIGRIFDRFDETIAYAIGITAAYWLVERTIAFLA
jgi:hypothetical protein